MNREARYDWLVSLSHELRTSLSAILGYAEMMYDAKQPVSQRLSCIGRIRRNAEEMAALLDRQSDFSKLEAGTIEMHGKKIHWVDELTETMLQLKQKAGVKRMGFEVEGAGLPKYILSDPVLLREVFFLVISSLMDRSHKGGIALDFEMVELESSKPGLSCNIYCSGLPYSMEQWSTWFGSPPTAVINGSDTSSEETLLGEPTVDPSLDLAARICRALDGDIQLISCAKRKAPAIRITVGTGPVEGVARLDDIVFETAEVVHSVDVTSVDDSRSCEGKKILLIEDNAEIQILVSHFLRRCGALVDIAGTGAEGIKRACGSVYDLILMDIQLPILDGYQATRTIRKEGVLTPIIAVTAFAMKGVKESCLTAGCTDYVTKPLAVDTLLHIVKQYVH